MTYEIDDNPARIDVGAAIDFLTAQAYWSRHRGAGEIARQIASAWRVVGAYDGAGAMVGFARAFSDGDSAYLTDVYVLPGHRGHGLGRAIVRAMIEDGTGAGQRWMLHTTDAHGLYRQFGFAAPRGRYLERPGGHGPAADRPPGAGRRRGRRSPASTCDWNRSATVTCRDCWPRRPAAVSCTAGRRCPGTSPQRAGTSRRPWRGGTRARRSPMR